MTASLSFLLDVDNTLLENDRLKSDLASRLQETIGVARSERFWTLYEEIRRERDYVDFPETIKRLCMEDGDPALESTLQQLLENWPFERYVYPHVFATLAYLRTLGTVAIVSDGDSVFQPMKIRKSGLEAAVSGNVVVYVHKEQNLADVFRRFPGDHYVAVDDKPRIISDLEQECPRTFTTILVLQGKYARPDEFEPRPDYVIQHIGDLRQFSRRQFLEMPRAAPR